VADVKPNELNILDDGSIDVFFNALHGTFGEDGALQEILESKGLVYTGSDSRASQLAFDKWESKKCFTKAGVPTPDAVLYESKIREDRLWTGQKYVIKPLREGSTIGITIAENAKQAVADAGKCAAEFGDCMIEKYIAGREVTVGVLGKKALPILEIRPRASFYDYHAKYIDDKTEYLFDTIKDAVLVSRTQKMSIDCFDALGCRGAARVDFSIGEDNIPYALEINTIPGMTNHSLLPKAAARIGISMSQLCMKMVEMAMTEANIKKTPVRRK
jgi:D-alanine-D-alanine ligase